MNVLSHSQLPELTDNERLDVFNLLTAGCHHLWSKNKLQQDKLLAVLRTLYPLTQNDPYFLAHLTSYALRKINQNDIRIVTSYVNALSSADGQPFSPGSKYNKPNLRMISAAAVHMMNPKQVKRMIEITRMKWGIDNQLTEATHFPNSLRHSMEKFVKYRENNIEMIEGIKKEGLANIFQSVYALLNLSPSDEAAAILRWQQKSKKIEFKKPLVDFTGLSDLEVAKTIRKKKLSVLWVLGALRKKISPVVAVALLEQCTGNQAVILTKTFEDAGVLADPEVLKMYQEKVASAKTALDRVDKIKSDMSEAVKQTLKQARADVRKEQAGPIGKIYLHIDISGSMSTALEFAREKAAIIAECVNNPQENFRWGLFNTMGEELPLPEEFVQDAFKKVLFGRHAGGGTNVAALYGNARQFGADCDVIVSDGGHNNGYLNNIIKSFHDQYPQFTKPRSVVHVVTPGQELDRTLIKEAYESNGIPATVIEGRTLESSAGVAEAVRIAIAGPLQIVKDIMEEPLLELPRWYTSL